MREGTFHVWAIETVNQAIELMTGIPAGETDKKDSFHGKVDRRLQSMADALKSQRAEGERYAIPATASEVNGQRDPRPPLPPEINKKH